MPEPPRISRGNRGQSGAVRSIASGQWGIVARAQLQTAGGSRWGIDRALRSGRLHRIHKGVYSTQAPELAGEDALLIAALLAAGDGAVLSHRTAAWRWHIISAPPPKIERAVPRDRKAPPGLTLHESKLRPDDRILNVRFPSTSVARTLLDVATRYEHDALLRALAEAEFRHDLRPADVRPTFRRGHPGSANLRAAPNEQHRATATSRATWSAAFARCCSGAGSPFHCANQRLGPWTSDRDDDRDLWLRRNRYVARRYGKRQIDDRPVDVVADLLDAFTEAITLGYATG